MLRRNLLCLLLALALLPALPAAAEALPCFSDGTLNGQVLGICVTDAPEAGLLLENRTVKPGDVLTAEQAARLTFAGGETTMEYLPIGNSGAGEPVVLTIGKKQTAPVAEDSALETYQDLPIQGACKVTGEGATVTVTRQPRRGTLTMEPDGSFTYTPKKKKVGVDSFTYTATSPDGQVSREATVTITVLKPLDSTQYTDTKELDCRFTAQWLKNTGIFTGETLGETLLFHPEKPVTRGEFVTMLVKVLDLPVDENLKAQGYTDDVPQWLQPYLAAAQRSGLTAALKDKETFSCDEAIPAEEAQAMVTLALGDTVEAMAELSDAPEAALTRSQAANLLYQTAKAE